MNGAINWPNALSVLRVLMVPLLILLALQQRPHWYLLVLICSIATDVLDGFLARHLQQVTRLGSQLDSWGDFLIYTSMAGCAWILWPGVFLREGAYFAILALCCTVPALVGAIKFSTLVSYHTWSTKLAVAVAGIGYILLFAGVSTWPFKLGVLLAVYAAVEAVAISWVLPAAHADIRSIWQALKIAPNRH